MRIRAKSNYWTAAILEIRQDQRTLAVEPSFAYEIAVAFSFLFSPRHSSLSLSLFLFEKIQNSIKVDQASQQKKFLQPIKANENFFLLQLVTSGKS